MRQITPEQANAAYDILVKHAGASGIDWHRQGFVHAVSITKTPTTEYRFQGSLGFGGKFRNNGNNGDVPHVDCYREDETPKRRAVILATNALLAELFAAPPPAAAREGG